jgi:hypothetical protein
MLSNPVPQVARVAANRIAKHDAAIAAVHASMEGKGQPSPSDQESAGLAPRNRREVADSGPHDSTREGQENQDKTVKNEHNSY